MDIWITKVIGRTATCNYCGNEIVKGDYIVRGKLWKAKNYAETKESRLFSLSFRWHIDCWTKNGKAHADEKFSNRVETRGRPKLQMPNEMKLARRRLVMRRANVVKRIQVESDLPLTDTTMNRLIHLGDMLNIITQEMKSNGGVPNSWL